jgi:hypothetical protein
MADHVHPGPHTPQPSGGNAPGNRVPPNPKLGQLATGHKPVLRLRQSRHPGIRHPGIRRPGIRRSGIRRPVCVNPRHHTRFPFDTHPQVAGPRVTGG